MQQAMGLFSLGVRKIMTNSLIQTKGGSRATLVACQSIWQSFPVHGVATILLLKYNIRPVGPSWSAWDDLASLDEVVQGRARDFLAQQHADVLLLAVEPGFS